MPRRIRKSQRNIQEFVTVPTTVEDEERAIILFSQAVTAAQDGKCGTALELYKEALAYKPGFSEAWINMGTIWFTARDFVMAAECYDKALAIDPHNAFAHYCRAKTLENRALIKEASDHFLRALAISPRFADAHFDLAWFYQYTGDDGQAIWHYKCYLRYSLTNEEYYSTIARKRIKELTLRLRSKSTLATVPNIAKK